MKTKAPYENVWHAVADKAMAVYERITVAIRWWVDLFRPIPAAGQRPAPRPTDSDPVNPCYCGFCGYKPCRCFGREAA